MNVEQVLNLIEQNVGELEPSKKSDIEMALYDLFHQAWNEGYGEGVHDTEDTRGSQGG